MAGDRGGDLAGAAPSGAQRSDLQAGQFAKRASFTRSVKETGPAIPGHGKGPLLPVLPVNTGHALPSPVFARSALIKIKKIGAEGPRGYTRPSSAIEQITSPATMK